MSQYNIEIKDKQIPIQIRNYKNSNRVKLYFRENILHISKPKYFSKKQLLKMLKENEEAIYKEYVSLWKKENTNQKHWYTGEIFYYEGEPYEEEMIHHNKNEVSIRLDKKEKKLLLYLPEDLKEEEKKKLVDSLVKKLLKKNTEVMLEEKLPKWSKKMNLEYQGYKVRDTVSKYGSCVPQTKMLYFSARLKMLTEEQVDSIIVHELAHLVHANHQKPFYDLVKKYIPNYDAIHQELKKNQKRMMI